MSDQMNETEEVEEQSSVKIEIDGDVAEFKAKRFANKFLLVKLLPDIDKAGFEQLAAVTRLVESQVLPEELERLDEWLELHGDSDEYANALWQGLSLCWQGETHFPFESSSDSSEPTSTDATED